MWISTHLAIHTNLEECHSTANSSSNRNNEGMCGRCRQLWEIASLRQVRITAGSASLSFLLSRGRISCLQDEFSWHRGSVLRYDTSGFAVVKLSVPMDDKSKEDATPSPFSSAEQICQSKENCGHGNRQHERLPQRTRKLVRVPLSLIRYASSNSMFTQSKQMLATKLVPASTAKLTSAKHLGHDLAARIEGYASAGKFPVGVPLLFAGSSSKHGHRTPTHLFHSARAKQDKSGIKHTPESNQVGSEGVTESEAAGDQHQEQKEATTPAVRIRTRVYLWLSSLCFVVANSSCREVGWAMGTFVYYDRLGRMWEVS